MHLRSARIEMASPDYRSTSLRPVSQQGVNAPMAALSVNDVPGAYAYESREQGERLVLRQMQGIDASREQARARGTVRTTAPATTFTLIDHPVRAVMLVARGQPDPRAHPPPTIHGVQTAIVVGLNEPVHTDRDHRIKVQFRWQRGGNGSHRLDAPSGDNAPASDASGTWVRVGECVAGANWGTSFIPRLGQEVLVAFTHGDIDRPWSSAAPPTARAKPTHKATRTTPVQPPPPATPTCGSRATRT